MKLRTPPCILLILLLTSFTTSSLYAQNSVETGFELTNAKPPKMTGDTLFYRYFFPKKFQDYFFSASDTAFLVRTDKETGEQARRVIVRSDMKKQHRSPLYGFMFKIGSLDEISNMKPHTLELMSSDGANSTMDKITEKDIKKLDKIYGEKASAKNARQQIKNYVNSGDSQGSLMGANRNITVVKRKKCAAKKRQFRREGINGVKEMTTGF